MMTKFMEWQDSYATGIDAIDADHKKLFAAVNALHDARDIDAGNAYFADLFAMLSDYVDTHFAREEELMRGLGYPELDAHIVSHRELATTVQQYAKLYRDDPGAVSRDEVLRFLGNWLSKHIMVSDMDYVPYVQTAQEAAAQGKVTAA